MYLFACLGSLRNRSCDQPVEERKQNPIEFKINHRVEYGNFAYLPTWRVQVNLQRSSTESKLSKY